MTEPRNDHRYLADVFAISALECRGYGRPDLAEFYTIKAQEHAEWAEYEAIRAKHGNVKLDFRNDGCSGWSL